MDQAQWFWARVPSTIKDVNDANMPTRRATRFFLLRDLRGGADGRVWRACTTSGTGCAIKFCKRSSVRDQTQRLEAEAEVWRAAWGVKGVRVATLVGEPALVMPYARVIKEPRSNKIKQQVRDAIDEMASRGFCHEDLAWRHVGRLGLRQQWRRVVFFDLARVSPVDTRKPKSVTAAKAKMLNALGLA